MTPATIEEQYDEPRAAHHWDPVRLPDIAFCGKAGSGKSTAAMHLVRAYGYRRDSIAQTLKNVAVDIWGTDAATDREKLQRLGTAVREIDEDAWVNTILDRIKEDDAYAELGDHMHPETRGGRSPIVVDDLRFPNEFYALKGAGFKIVRVYADVGVRFDRLQGIGKIQEREQLNHVSETALDGFGSTDALVVNGYDVDSFLEQVDKVVEWYQLRAA